MGGVLLQWKDEWLFEEITKQSRTPFDKIKDHFNANISDLFVGRITEKQFWQKIPGLKKPFKDDPKLMKKSSILHVH
jgi:hypothetical protein